MTFRDHGTGRDRRNEVVDVQRVTPHLVRITLAGEDLRDYVDNGGDQHVAVLFFGDEVIVPDPFTGAAMKRMRPYVRPRMRRYTIRRFEPESRTLEIDVLVHDDDGPGTQWASSVRVGDLVYWWGPTEAWHPDPGTEHVLLVGDETALPAIEAIVRETAARIRVSVVAEVTGAQDEPYLAEVAHSAEITWVHRDADPSTALARFLEAVRSLPPATSTTQVWGATEYRTVQALRRHFHADLGLDRQRAFLVTYWTRGQPQDERAERRDEEITTRNRLHNPDDAAEFLRR